MGNRGQLHDDQRRIVRPFQVRRWIACELEFRGRRRRVMTPRRYTELFFVDEAVALSAGHRPCAECRRADYLRFRALWEACHGRVSTVDAIDDVLHGERLDGRAKRTHRGRFDALPDGTFVAMDGDAWLVWRDELLAWSGHGYGARRARPRTGDVQLLTPPGIVAVLAAGYSPRLHPTAFE